jgi:hypothetical protein
LAGAYHDEDPDQERDDAAGRASDGLAGGRARTGEAMTDEWEGRDESEREGDIGSTTKICAPRAVEAARSRTAKRAMAIWRMRAVVALNALRVMWLLPSRADATPDTSVDARTTTIENDGDGHRAAPFGWRADVDQGSGTIESSPGSPKLTKRSWLGLSLIQRLRRSGMSTRRPSRSSSITISESFIQGKIRIFTAGPLAKILRTPISGRSGGFAPW